MLSALKSLKTSSHDTMTQSKHVTARDALRAAEEAYKSLLREASTFLSVRYLGEEVLLDGITRSLARDALATLTFGTSLRASFGSQLVESEIMPVNTFFRGLPLIPDYLLTG